MTNLINAGNRISVALMAELVDAQVSGTCDRFGRGSSSLLQGTIIKTAPLWGFFYYGKKNLSVCQPTTAERSKRYKYFDRSGVVLHLDIKSKTYEARPTKRLRWSLFEYGEKTNIGYFLK